MRSYFYLEDSYEDAIKNTYGILIPLAVMITKLHPDFTYPPGYEIGEQQKDNLVLVALTTSFNIKEYNDKWGWYHLESDTKREIGKIIIDKRLEHTWTYWSQKKVEGEEK